jgi:hypothetical protein
VGTLVVAETNVKPAGNLAVMSTPLAVSGPPLRKLMMKLELAPMLGVVVVDCIVSAKSAGSAAGDVGRGEGVALGVDSGVVIEGGAGAVT